MYDSIYFLVALAFTVFVFLQFVFLLQDKSPWKLWLPALSFLMLGIALFYYLFLRHVITQ